MVLFLSLKDKNYVTHSAKPFCPDEKTKAASLVFHSFHYKQQNHLVLCALVLGIQREKNKTKQNKRSYLLLV